MSIRSVIVSLVAVVCLASPALAASGSPFQLALFDPVQIVKRDKSVSGVRLNIIYGRNANLTGLDVGIINHSTGNEGGLQYGAIGYVEGEFTGWQDNLVSISKTKFTGLQSGWFTQSADGHGVQFGFINITDRMSGLQFGIVNYTKVMDKGMQIGIGNIISEGGIPFLPLVNWRF